MKICLELRQWLPAVLVLLMPARVLWAAEREVRTIDLHALTELVISHDPALESLRGAIADADFRVAVAGRGRSPEIRVRYGESDSWSLPDPYTETSIETINEFSAGDTTSSQAERTGTIVDQSMGSESSSQAETSTRETVRTITPDRDGVTIRETVTESGSGQFTRNDIATDSVDTTTRDESGSYTSSVVSDSSESRRYGRDVYGGSSSYSVQLRLFPSHPFLEKAARQQQIIARSQVELTLEAALQRAVLSVAEQHREIQFMLAEFKVMQRRADLLKADLEGLGELKAARAINPGEYYTQRTKSMIYLARLTELKRTILDATGALRIRAGLDADLRITFAGNLHPPREDFKSLNRSRLVELALERSAALVSVRTSQLSIESDIKAQSAERIPWLSFVSLDYGVDDADNGQSRDEWSVYAGVELPVGAWFDGASRKAMDDRLGSVERQELLMHRQVELAVGRLCQSLTSAQSDWTSFADSTRQAKGEIKQQLTLIDGNDLTARRTRLALSESLIDMDMQRIRLAHRLSGLLFKLCDTIGCDLPLVIETGLSESPAKEVSDADSK
jgi:hypothetical protein